MADSMKPFPALTLESVGKTFRKTQALSDVSLEVPEGSLTAILGPAGAGKTTALRVVAGLETPDSGRVLLGGQDVAGWEPKDRDVAMIFDNLALYPNKTGFQNLASPLTIRKVDRQTVKAKVEAMATTLKISHVLERLPKTMSGGERQRVALGRALIRSPRLFLLDEPLSSLDAMLRIELRAELKRLQRECGCTFLMATPDYTEALAIADAVALLRQGRIVQFAPPQELYDLPVDLEAARFVGAPRINDLDARYLPDAEAGARVIEVAGGRLPAPASFVAAFGGQPRALTLGVRPENLVVVDPESAPILMHVVDVEPLGLKSTLTARNDGAELRVLAETSQLRDLAPGQPVGLALADPESALAFDPATGARLAPAR